MEIPGLDVQGSPPGGLQAGLDSETRITHYKAVSFIFRAGMHLQMGVRSVAAANHLYHRVFTECRVGDCDPYLVASTCIYLGSKVEEEHKRLRDVINVCYRTLHEDKPPLDIGSLYWALRESVIQCELFVMRLLKFQVVINHPHKYLLHYLRSLNTWLAPETVSRVPYTSTAWSILRDSYHGDVCLHYPANKLAVAVLYLALQCHGISVPYNDDAEDRWWEAFVEDLKLTEIRKIIHRILDVYDIEKVAGS